MSIDLAYNAFNITFSDLNRMTRVHHKLPEVNSKAIRIEKKIFKDREVLETFFREKTQFFLGEISVGQIYIWKD